MVLIYYRSFQINDKLDFGKLEDFKSIEHLLNAVQVKMIHEWYSVNNFDILIFYFFLEVTRQTEKVLYFKN